MNTNIFEMLRDCTIERSNWKREMYNSLRDSNLRLKKYIEESGDCLNGKRYIPEVGSGYCSLTVVNKEQNIKEELYYSRNLRCLNYKVWTMDFSIRPIEYDYTDHRDCLIENANRILEDVNNILDMQENNQKVVI